MPSLIATMLLPPPPDHFGTLPRICHACHLLPDCKSSAVPAVGLGFRYSARGSRHDMWNAEKEQGLQRQWEQSQHKLQAQEEVMQGLQQQGQQLGSKRARRQPKARRTLSSPTVMPQAQLLEAQHLAAQYQVCHCSSIQAALHN